MLEPILFSQGELLNSVPTLTNPRVRFTKTLKSLKFKSILAMRLPENQTEVET